VPVERPGKDRENVVKYLKNVWSIFFCNFCDKEGHATIACPFK
jgi:hypothetical protein